MKKQTVLALIVAIATTMTVSAQTIALHSTTGVQIFKGNTALALAYTAAASGDTLYLSGGTFTPPATFDKKLMILGAGHYADSAQTTGKTFINGNVSLSENSDQSYFEGIEFNGNFSTPNNVSVNSFTLKRCRVVGNFTFEGDLNTNPCTNVALIGNVFMGSVNSANMTGSMIANNIFSNALHNTNGNLIINNDFLNGIYSSYQYYVFSGNNNTLNNNIFVYASGLAYSASAGNVYNNNLFVSATPGYGTTPSYVGNYVNIAQTAIFVNQTGNVFDYGHDYHLQDPVTYIGNDATQVGIYGGSFPYKEGAVPMNPHIQVKNIAPTTDANSELQIQIQVKAQND
jgi:hypothetical protein